ncbi:hypothetical protein [Bacteroides sp.]
MDWNKWIIERLPRKLRVVGVFALCVVLTSYIRQLYDEFVEWRRKLRTRMAGTPQVCQLRKIVHDELGVDIEIEEGDGRPTDFIIKTAFVNIDKERRLFALLNRYKLAGKNYGYENAKIVIAYTWGDYICERAILEYNVNWTNYACEKTRTNRLQFTAYWVYHEPTNQTRVKRLVFHSDAPLASEVCVTLHGSLSPRMNIPKGSQDADIDVLLLVGNIESITIIPGYESDDYYDYVVDELKHIYE